jgi:hypothetical protein
MGITRRSSRPLTREQSDYRDDRLFIVACDDTYAPVQYFDSFKIERVKIHMMPTVDCDSHASHVLERLLSIEHRPDDELWMLLDTDHCIKPGHIRSFRNALRNAKKRNVKVALSRSCFEIWLLLHHLNESDVAKLGNAAEVEKKLRETLGVYDKTALDTEKFGLSKVAEACARAFRLDKAGRDDLIPKSTTTRVHRLWQSIVDGASVAQLPNELLSLKQR